MEFQIGPYAKLVSKPERQNKFVTLCDSSMRDGEQANVKYSLEEKIRFLAMLDEAHVPEMQIASLRNEKTIAEAEQICAVKRAYTKIEIMSRSTAPGWRTELAEITRLNADIMHTLLPISPRLRGAYGPVLDDEALVKRTYEVVSYGKSLGAKIFNLSLLDVTRTEIPLLQKVVSAGIAGGADRICIADTVGCATPEMIAYLVRTVKSWVPDSVGIRVHVHNDFGLATANALAAVSAGAEYIDTCINGLGKRAGNVDMVQVMMALKAFYSIDTGIDEQKLYLICKMIEGLSGTPIPLNNPFIGDLVFADSSESHITGNRIDPFAFQSINPVGWGNPYKVLIDNSSGMIAMQAKLDELGYAQQNEEKLRSILQACIVAFNKLGRGKYLTDDVVRKICTSFIEDHT